MTILNARQQAARDLIDPRKRFELINEQLANPGSTVYTDTVNRSKGINSLDSKPNTSKSETKENQKDLFKKQVQQAANNSNSVSVSERIRKQNQQEEEQENKSYLDAQQQNMQDQDNQEEEVAQEEETDLTPAIIQNRSTDNISQNEVNLKNFWENLAPEQKRERDLGRYVAETGDVAGSLFGSYGLLDPGTKPVIGNPDKTADEYVDNRPNFQTLQVSDDETINAYNRLAKQNRIVDDAERSAVGEFANSRIDDTTFNNPNSAYMTGEMYKLYHEQMGTGGRPVESIDDNDVYRKSDEQRLYNFNPVITDQEAIDNINLDRVTSGINQMTNKLADIREDSRGDWYINDITTPDGRTLSGINGDLFNKEAIPYFEALSSLSNKERADRVVNQEDITEDILNDPNYIKFAQDGFAVYDGDGEPTVFNGITSSDISYNEDQMQDILNTGNTESLPFTIYFTASDGDPVEIEFDSYDEFQQNFRPNTFQSTDPTNDTIVQAEYREPLVLSDGTEIDYNTALGILSGDQDYNADYGLLNWNKPRDQLNDFISFDEEGMHVDPSDLAPTLADVFLGSVPYMAPLQVMVPSTLSNMYVAGQGLDARSQDSNAYQRVAEDLDDERYLSNIIDEGLIAGSEKLFGVGGGKLLGGGIAKKIAPRSPYQPYLRALESSIGEGVEEIIQSPIEENQMNGFKYMYADQLYDKYGNPMYDSTNHELRDEHTPLDKRITNALTSMPNDFAIGAMLGGGMNLVNPGMHSQVAENRRMRQLGLDPYEVTMYDRYQALSDEELQDLRKEGSAE